MTAVRRGSFRNSFQGSLLCVFILLTIIGAVALAGRTTPTVGALSTTSAGANGDSYCFGQAIVPQTSADTATIIDQSSDLITQTIGTNAQPFAVTYSGDGRLAFVANLAGQPIDVIDTRTNSVSRTLPVSDSISDIVSNEDGSIVWIATDGYAPGVSRISGSTGALTARYTAASVMTDLILAPDGTTLWALEDNGYGTTILELDPATLTIRTSTMVAALGYQSALSPDGSKLYIPDVYNNTGILVFDTRTRVTAQMGPANSFINAVISPDGRTLFSVVNGASDDLYAFDLLNNTWSAVVDLATIAPIYYLFYGIAITADGTKLYVTNYNYANSGLFIIETANPTTGSFLPTLTFSEVATCPLAVDPAAAPTTTTTDPDAVIPTFTG